MTTTPARQRGPSVGVLITAGVALGFGAAALIISFHNQYRPSPVSGKAPVIVPTGRSDATAVLDPASFSGQQQREAYAAARQVSAVLNQLYCWCHCKESTIFHHRSLLECFESDHGSQCSTCMGEATLAHDMVQRGVTDVRQIQNAIDLQFGPLARRRT
jgi:Protein of unknown function with PCYCGC motif